MHLIIALVLQATTPEVAAPTEPPQAPPTETAQQERVMLQLEPEMVCRWEVPAGQRIRRRVCREVSAMEAQAEASSEAAREMSHVRGGSYEE